MIFGPAQVFGAALPIMACHDSVVVQIELISLDDCRLRLGYALVLIYWRRDLSFINWWLIVVANISLFSFLCSISGLVADVSDHRAFQLTLMPRQQRILLEVAADVVRATFDRVDVGGVARTQYCPMYDVLLVLDSIGDLLQWLPRRCVA